MADEKIQRWRPSCLFINLLVRGRVRQGLCVLVLVGMIFWKNKSETRYDSVVESVDLAAGLGVICSRGQVFDDQMDSNACEELWHQFQSVIGKQMGFNHVRDDLIIHKRGCWIHRGYCGDREVPGQLCVPVVKMIRYWLPNFVFSNGPSISIPIIFRSPMAGNRLNSFIDGFCPLRRAWLQLTTVEYASSARCGQFNLHCTVR